MLGLGGGGYGQNTNVGNAPVIPGTDSVYVIVEFEQAGSGLCYGGITGACTGLGNTQTCKVP